MATLDDLVNVLTVIATEVAGLPKEDAGKTKINKRFRYETLVKQVMAMKELSEEDAIALIESWRV